MSSEHLASAQTELKGDLGASWNILDGASANYTDLGVARGFGGSSAAYSLRDIGAMNGPAVRVRRSPHDTSATVNDEQEFAASEVSSGALEDWVNGKLETTLPADVATAEVAYSLRRVSKGKTVYQSDFSAGTDDIGKNISNQDDVTITGNVDGISDGSTSKDNVLKVENNATFTPQLKNLDTGYRGATDGIVEFTYYVPTGHPIIGNYWHIGTADGGATPPEVIYSGEGEKIVGGAWTTATIKFGRRYSPFGVDKPDDKSFRFLTILDQRVSDGTLNTPITANDGDIYYISDITVTSIKDPVRIRRGSDGIEVNVAFDSNDKVSASSAITNVAEQGGESGQTNSTNLNEFLNEIFTVGVAVEGGNGTDRPDSFTNASNSSFTASVTETAGGYFPYKTAAGDAVTVSFNLVVSGGASPSINTALTVSSIATRAAGTQYNSSGSYTFTLNCTASADHIRFADSDDGTFAVTNFRVTSHTHRTFVHTWYDQVGSNDAVQITAAKQPKIAESGALLADGIEFDGSDDALNFTDLTLTDASIFTVVNIDSSEDQQLILGGSASTATATMIPMMDDASTTTQVYKNATVGGAEQGSSQLRNAATQTLSDRDDAFDALAVDNKILFTMLDVDVAEAKVLDGISQTPADATTWGLKGTMEELIIYNSDQTSNRFLIESNINNYYGLYNDEYEWDDATNTEWQNNVTDGTTTFTANGKDGFTITATGENISSFKYKLTSPATASNNYYRVSFNVDDPDGLFEDAQLRLTATGSGATAQTIANGFNSLSLRTGSSFEYMSINSDGDGSSKTATLSDFKISRIARNGLVETWYDQSKNGRNLTQDTAGSQPSIIMNGGIVKTNNGYPGISFDGTDDFLRTGDYEPADEPNGMTDFNLTCVTGRPPTQTQRVVASCGSQEGSHVIGGFYFSNNETSGQPTKQDIRFNISEHDVTTPTSTSHIDQKIITATPLQDTNLLSFNRKGSDNTFESFSMSGTKLTGTSLVPKTGQNASSGADFKVGASMYHGTGRKYYLGEILEVVLFDSSDKRDDAPDINSNLKHYYNI